MSPSAIRPPQTHVADDSDSDSTPSTSGKHTPTTLTSSLVRAGIKSSLETNSAPLANEHSSELSPLDASRLQTTLTSQPRAVPLPNDPCIAEQRTCTDHMITARWALATGWDAPELKPYGPLSLMPTASVLHYATECFEGLKLYRGHDGRLRLFRPSRNCARMRASAARIALPDFAAAELQRLIVALCARDGPRWLPRERPGAFLYIRPAMIATDSALGVQRPKEALLYVVLAFLPDMTKSLSSISSSSTSAPAPGLKLLASREDTIRAWPGGFGHAKVGANYGPSLVAQGQARALGYDQILWLFGPDCAVTEAGASNFFVVWRARGSHRIQLVTAPLTDKIILDGVTRASVLSLAEERLGGGADGEEEGLEVVERSFSMGDVMQAYEEGRLLEAFAAGTAFFIAPVRLIHFRGVDLTLPADGPEANKYTLRIKGWLQAIMYGKEKHEWGVVVDEIRE
ncbi:hypothetical protein LTR50_003016 [Elasticomyces elasticus]|nr:hypothetical protein LTR50_003016 [Elasticomyces elasticus]